MVMDEMRVKRRKRMMERRVEKRERKGMGKDIIVMMLCVDPLFQGQGSPLIAETGSNEVTYM